MTSYFKLNSDYDKLYLLVVLLSTLLPKFDAIDSSSVRWLALAVINLIYIIYYFIQTSNRLIITKKIINATILIFFILISSLLVAPNFNDGVLTSYKICLLLVTFIFGYNALKNINSPIKFIAYILTFSLIIESVYAISAFIFIQEGSLSGISMNSNISSFSILLKIPFLFYLIQTHNFIRLKGLLRFTELLSILSIIILQSRAAIVCLLLLYFYLLLFSKSSRKHLLVSLSVFIASFSIFISSPLANKVDAKSINPINLGQDKSFNQRVSNYKSALSLFSEKPIFGHGIGSWKVKSLKFQNLDDKNLIIPYYVHNDFLQILVESGILGFILYVFFFLYLIILLLRNFDSGSLLLCTVIIFFIDSSLNFPIHRPQIIVPFIIISLLILKINERSNIKLNKLLMSVLLILSCASVYISYKEYRSYVFQDDLLTDYYGKTYKMSISEISKIDYKLPNLSSNTIPISAYLARYYINDSRLKQAKDLLTYSKQVNPYDVLTKQLQMGLYLSENNFYEAFIVSKDLLYGDMNNDLYSEIYFSLIQELKLIEDLVNSDILYSTNNLKIHKQFFDTYLKLEIGEKEKLRTLLDYSIKIFPNELYFKSILSLINQNTD